MKAKKILVVEDDKVAQKLIVDALKAAGYEVATAYDGATAVAKARELEPDLVTLDIQLAKDSSDDTWDGFSVATWLRRISESKSKPVIIVISGLEPDQIIESAANIGAYTFLPKPFTKQKLLDLVAEALKATPEASAD